MTFSLPQDFFDNKRIESVEDEGFRCSCGEEMIVVSYLVVTKEVPSFVAICPACDKTPIRGEVIRPDDDRS